MIKLKSARKEITTVRLGGDVIPRTTVLFRLGKPFTGEIDFSPNEYLDLYDDCMSHMYWADKGEKSFYCIASRCRLIREIYTDPEFLEEYIEG